MEHLGHQPAHGNAQNDNSNVLDHLEPDGQQDSEERASATEEGIARTPCVSDDMLASQTSSEALRNEEASLAGSPHSAEYDWPEEMPTSAGADVHAQEEQETESRDHDRSLSPIAQATEDRGHGRLWSLYTSTVPDIQRTAREIRSPTRGARQLADMLRAEPDHVPDLPLCAQLDSVKAVAPEVERARQRADRARQNIAALKGQLASPQRGHSLRVGLAAAISPVQAPQTPQKSFTASPACASSTQETLIQAGDRVQVVEDFVSNNKKKIVFLKRGMLGVVKDIADDGNAMVEFVSAQLLTIVKPEDFGKLTVEDESTTASPGTTATDACSLDDEVSIDPKRKESAFGKQGEHERLRDCVSRDDVMKRRKECSLDHAESASSTGSARPGDADAPKPVANDALQRKAFSVRPAPCQKKATSSSRRHNASGNAPPESAKKGHGNVRKDAPMRSLKDQSKTSDPLACRRKRQRPCVSDDDSDNELEAQAGNPEKADAVKSGADEGSKGSPCTRRWKRGSLSPRG